jgi:hypothetical protein
MNIKIGFDPVEGDNYGRKYFSLILFSFPVFDYSVVVRDMNERGDIKYRDVLTLFGIWIAWWK